MARINQGSTPKGPAKTLMIRNVGLFGPRICFQSACVGVALTCLLKDQLMVNLGIRIEKGTCTQWGVRTRKRVFSFLPVGRQEVQSCQTSHPEFPCHGRRAWSSGSELY